MKSFFEDLKEGLEDAVAHERGKKTLRSHLVEIPEKPSLYTSEEIKKIRRLGNYSQSVFALILNVSVKTVQSWESGCRAPCHAALRLLEIIEKGIYRPIAQKNNAF
jgi:putative transcriptional regulator